MDSPPVPATKRIGDQGGRLDPIIERRTKLTISSSEIATLDHEPADTGTEGMLRSNYKDIIHVAELRALLDDTMETTVFVP